MTVFGLDVSSFQRVNIGTLHKQGFEFFAAKCTEGAGWADPTYAGHLAEARACGALFVAYHFVHSDASAAAQADNIARHIIDKSVPVMLDCEPTGGSHPSLGMCNALRAELHARGIRATIIYDPHFWWDSQGRPSLKGWSLWQAEYPSSKNTYASVLYSQDGGDHSADWAAEGGVVPVIWQFGSTARTDGVAGNLDADAFRGTRAQLSATGMFRDFSPHPAPNARPTPPPSRITRFHDELKRTNHVNVGLLDGAVNAGRKQGIPAVRYALVADMAALPKDGPRVLLVHSNFDKHRIIDLNLLAQAVKYSFRPSVRQIYNDIHARVALLPNS
jgi:GH25 family lysozyme M1 (1,4-beta-N-acetylmuramidase)